MLEKSPIKAPEGLRAVINAQYRKQEQKVITERLKEAELDERDLKTIAAYATQLVEAVREASKQASGIDSFLTEYSLSTDEGIVLMCLAEALLRVPDNKTINLLIEDKLTQADWNVHRAKSNSLFVNTTTWALMLTGKVLDPEKADSFLGKSVFNLMKKSSSGVIRKAVDAAMRIMSRQFVMGRTIEEALTRAKKEEAKGYCYSYDMLGEAALTKADAKTYFEAYKKAIEAIGKNASPNSTVYARAGISVKLSALHPRYEEAQHERVLSELAPKLLELAKLAKQFDIQLTVDAEESERLDISLDVIERVFCDASLEGWEGFGLAVQSYQKRAMAVLDWVAHLAKSQNRRMMVRLIKGAYWDSEIKQSQMEGLSDYPVFTRKVFTDVSFQACAKKLFTLTDAIYPQFATHNAYSVALVMHLAKGYRDFEFQCLHGMGRELYDQIVPAEKAGIPCRIYAPVGIHEDLLPYLVRRLLENGANSSFVNRLVDSSAPVSQLVEAPLTKAKALLDKINQNIPLPQAIYGPARANSDGIDWTDRQVCANLQKTFDAMAPFKWEASPLLAGRKTKNTEKQALFSPQSNSQPVGSVTNALEEDVEWALTKATDCFPTWAKTPVSERAACLRRFGDLLETHTTTFLAIACLEAGKTWLDGIAEVREAVDFCRYYADMAEKIMGEPNTLEGYTGELNQLSLHARGTILCISPWNFPLAIFTGQVVAALVTGNCVIAKPAAPTPLIAFEAVKLMHEAGFPEAAVQLLPGPGRMIGSLLVGDKRIKGVVFTGSTDTASGINQTLATRGGEIIPLIAETGGQNGMIVDSSALLEQVVQDVLLSAFGSAGQRCSALRVLYIQDEIYDDFETMLKGAMQELSVGDPCWLSTDVGPVINDGSLKQLKAHVDAMKQKHRLIYECELGADCADGTFMPPTAIAIDSMHDLTEEMFGPILHVVRYKQNKLDAVIDEVNSTGFGLTFGIHSRINRTVQYVRERIHAGNFYVNRNTTGAVVGLQPFGGEGLSGTGPKAGGPQYLLRFCHERTYTEDTTAAGGNASLMSLDDDIDE
ncbi:MAG: bifunctional proline dehydrogenase/L-glutamate gamma-semialdehyde dehydrogenase PutA [Gammaproteobacteria bacterium]|nr:bifunctional proline dehydrogenase/L-glutamate gamma-semialdehyde dehydrogenase PutA [Gammaproteobacteria bacterium]